MEDVNTQINLIQLRYKKLLVEIKNANGVEVSLKKSGKTLTEGPASKLYTLIQSELKTIEKKKIKNDYSSLKILVESSNINFYETIWKVANAYKKVTFICLQISYDSNKASYNANDNVNNNANNARNFNREKVSVDIVCENGEKWVKIVSNILVDYMALELLELKEDALKTIYDNSPLALSAKKLLIASKQTWVGIRHPSITFVIVIDDDNEIDIIIKLKILNYLRSMSIQVDFFRKSYDHITDGNKDVFSQPKTILDQCSERGITKTINLGVTAMVLIVSDITNLNSSKLRECIENCKSVENDKLKNGIPIPLLNQIKEEINHDFTMDVNKSLFAKIIQHCALNNRVNYNDGREKYKLIAIESAVEKFKNLITTLPASPLEIIRATMLLGDTTLLSSAKINYRFANIPDDLFSLINIKSLFPIKIIKKNELNNLISANNTGLETISKFIIQTSINLCKENQVNKDIFSLGIQLDVTTITSNKKAVKIIGNQIVSSGMNILQSQEPMFLFIPARSLISQYYKYIYEIN